MTKPQRPWYTVLYIQVLIAIAVGILIGHYFPKAGVALKPLGDGFIALIKMMIAPVIFCTVVHGIASMGDLKKVGRVGVKTLFYFEVVSTLALAIGLLVGDVLQPGDGFNIDPATLDPQAVASYVTRAKEQGIVAHLLGIIPDSFIDAFANGDLLQVLLVSILTGFAIARLGERGERIAQSIEAPAKMFFGIIAHHRARRADRRVRRHGVHRRRVRRRARSWNLVELIGDVLPHQHPVRAGRAGHHRAARRASRSCASSPTSRTSC